MREKCITLRLTEAEYNRIVRQAEREYLTPAAYVRRLTLIELDYSDRDYEWSLQTTGDCTFKFPDNTTTNFPSMAEQEYYAAPTIATGATNSSDVVLVPYA